MDSRAPSVTAPRSDRLPLRRSHLMLCAEARAVMLPGRPGASERRSRPPTRRRSARGLPAQEPATGRVPSRLPLRTCRGRRGRPTPGHPAEARGGPYELRITTDESPRRVDLVHLHLRTYGTFYNTLAGACDVHGQVVAVQPAPGAGQAPPSRAPALSCRAGDACDLRRPHQLPLRPRRRPRHVCRRVTRCWCRPLRPGRPCSARPTGRSPAGVGRWRRGPGRRGSSPRRASRRPG